MEPQHRQLMLQTAIQILSVKGVRLQDEGNYTLLPTVSVPRPNVFSMADFHRTLYGDGMICGTAHCVLGWGQILSKTDIIDVFGPLPLKVCAWLFASDWDTHLTAWSARAAAHRIYYYLLHGGPPDDFKPIFVEEFEWEEFTTNFSYSSLRRQLRDELIEARQAWLKNLGQWSPSVGRLGAVSR